MQLTAELSLYPIQDEYIPVIQAFIDAVKHHDDLRVVCNAMSTQIAGEHDRVFEVVCRELAASYEQFGAQVLVAKFIPGIVELDD
ncbi:MAG: thiamine-binding protein [Halieaceae bacterium]|nr:thiamine-binding protein [Halieaceae bacterium]